MTISSSHYFNTEVSCKLTSAHSVHKLFPSRLNVRGCARAQASAPSSRRGGTAAQKAPALSALQAGDGLSSRTGGRGRGADLVGRSAYPSAFLGRKERTGSWITFPAPPPHGARHRQGSGLRAGLSVQRGTEARAVSLALGS